ncbi:MAG TPA: glycosyltransferase [Verrucomicrobiae bacterium]|nr:glycosyltransferase [Verrucomicrobiae bacterium]
MKVAIDAQLTVGTATGIGEYVAGLAAALRATGSDVVELSEPALDPWRFDRRVYWDQVLLPQRTRLCGATLLHCASGTVPLRVSVPVVVTVHDVAWLRVQHHARPYARYYFGRFSLDRYRSAAAIAVDSEFSRAELLDALGWLDPARVHVVYPGVAADFCSLRRRGSDGRTILAVGTVERRKNLELLVRALPFLEGARLVAVGPATPYLHECAAVAKLLDVADRVEFRGYVDRAELLDLYACAAVVAVPSQYEGFGYAAAQALCAGTPCIVSACSALPEVVGPDATVVEVDDLMRWVEGLATLLQGEGDARAAAARERAIERYAWSSGAEKMARIYAQALEGAEPGTADLVGLASSRHPERRRAAPKSKG